MNKWTKFFLIKELTIEEHKTTGGYSHEDKEYAVFTPNGEVHTVLSKFMHDTFQLAQNEAVNQIEIKIKDLETQVITIQELKKAIVVGQIALNDNK